MQKDKRNIHGYPPQQDEKKRYEFRFFWDQDIFQIFVYSTWISGFNQVRVHPVHHNYIYILSIDTTQLSLLDTHTHTHIHTRSAALIRKWI